MTKVRSPEVAEVAAATVGGGCGGGGDPRRIVSDGIGDFNCVGGGVDSHHPSVDTTTFVFLIYIYIGKTRVSTQHKELLGPSLKS